MTDAALSLRQAALMTLKRKAANNAQPPTHPMAMARGAPSIQLDYGAGDDDASQPAPEPEPAPQPPPPDTKADSPPETREEGEISDEEMQEPPPSASVPPTSPTAAPGEPETPRSVLALQAHPSLPPRPTSTTIKTATSKVPPRLKDKKSKDDPPTAPKLFPFQLDEQHVRPGLALTQTQYDAAKDIVLDLLGWDVPPEYLVDCGLSRNLVYYVFAELNLRMPANLDTTGIVPYPPPPEMLAKWLQAVEAEKEKGVVEEMIVEGLVEDKGKGKEVESDMPSLLARISDVPVEVEAPAPSLQDMEEQRRRELLARKAVQASRKRKESTMPPAQPPAKKLTPAPPSAGERAPVNIERRPQPVAPTDSVDDFLRSIAPVPLTESSTLSTDMPRTASPDLMDVDDGEIPGLSRNNSTVDVQSASTAQAPVTVSSSTAISSVEIVAPPAPASSHSKSSSSTPQPATPVAAAVGPTGTLPTSPARATAPAPRRAKRPVAADFVDAPPPAPAPTRPVVTLPYMRRAQSQTRTDAQSPFAALNQAPAHCSFIWESDSDAGDETPSGLAASKSSLSVTAPAFTPRGGAAANGGGNGASTPSATDLDRDIEKLRAMIREKEEMKLRSRLAGAPTTAAGSGRSTPVTATLAAAPVAAPAVKQETMEEDVQMGTAGEGDAGAQVNTNSPDDDRDSVMSTPNGASFL
ncbi:hypothetical protein PENSPDRAFT_260294 [Peniophora sp. CONT]|nr:hypothetical protein PENSPDRAFT_260294 [Peniophora sp. CONT]